MGRLPAEPRNVRSVSSQLSGQFLYLDKTIGRLAGESGARLACAEATEELVDELAWG